MNYQRELEETIKKIQLSREKNPQAAKPTLLLHACCGPCSSHVIESIARFFDITIFYYNPNIHPAEEYNRRLNELKDFLPRFEPALLAKVKLVEADYDPEEFYEAIKIKTEPELAHEREKGERCRRCYNLRLKKAHAYASENNFDFFCTTLSISPFKDAEKINREGKILSMENPSGPKWLYSDFKKKGGFLRSLEISEEFNLYRQQYCGCAYSKINTEKERAATKDAAAAEAKGHQQDRSN